MEPKRECEACKGAGGSRVVPSIPDWHPDYGNAEPEWEVCGVCGGAGYIGEDGAGE